MNRCESVEGKGAADLFTSLESNRNNAPAQELGGMILLLNGDSPNSGWIRSASQGTPNDSARSRENTYLVKTGVWSRTEIRREQAAVEVVRQKM